MRQKLFYSLLLSTVLISNLKAEEATIYDVINHNDIETFSKTFMISGYGVDDFDGDGYTPLMIAASLNKPEFVAFLIKNKADVNMHSFDGLTALHRAAIAGNNEIIDILVSSKADVNAVDAAGDTPLIYAVRANKRFTVERLIKLNADPHLSNRSGETALSIAKQLHFTEIEKFLQAY